MPCEDCEEPHSILRTPGSWFLEAGSSDIWTLTLTWDALLGDGPVTRYDIDLESKDQAYYWYARALQIIKKKGYSFDPSEYHQLGVNPFAFDGIEGVFRTRVLKEKIYMSGISGTPGFEEQAPE